MERMLCILLISMCFLGFRKPEVSVLAAGSQPEISVGNSGEVLAVFGRSDSIFISNYSHHQFEAPFFVGYVQNMSLGHTRGPQVALSGNTTMVTAVDKNGDIYWFLIDAKHHRLLNKGYVNDQRKSAPEGLMGLAAGSNGQYYATWLDLRQNHQNNIFFASYNPISRSWSASRMIYRSPEGHTCECCKPNIAVKNNHVAIMFRNWLNGSRDLYVAESLNNGKSFGVPQKLGLGTWKLDGCPMDGGSIVITDQNEVKTVWQREGVVYYSALHGKEMSLGKGRSCSISQGQKELVASFQDGGAVKLKDIENGKELTIGKGSYLKTTPLADHSLLCIWEDNDHIVYKDLRTSFN